MHPPHPTIMRILDALSHPGICGREEGLDQLAAALGRRTLSSLIGQWESDPQYSELVAFMHSARDVSSLGMAHFWGTGLAGVSVGTSRDETLPTTLEFCLRLSAAGCLGRWQVPVPSRRRIGLGSYQMHVEGFVSVVSSVDALRLRTAGNRYSFRRDGHQLHAEGKDRDLSELSTFSIGGRDVVIIDALSLASAATATALPARKDLDWDVDRTPWVGAVKLLETHSPSYERWCGRVLRSLILLDSGGRPEMFSASTAQRPGVVESSHHPEAIKNAESLVHEASHQHFFLAEMLGAVDDGSDTKLYYSPVVQRERPIDRILFAYHAFANVMLLYRACLRAGVDTGGFCELEHDKLSAPLHHLDSTLRATTALTSVGRALWTPLARELEATS